MDGTGTAGTCGPIRRRHYPRDALLFAITGQMEQQQEDPALAAAAAGAARLFRVCCDGAAGQRGPERSPDRRVAAPTPDGPGQPECVPPGGPSRTRPGLSPTRGPALASHVTQIIEF
jgi:hypothetical protein